MNNIIQWNCRGLRANFTDFRLLCDKYNPIVCCLQETMLTKNDFIIRGFNCIHLTSRDIGGRACGGVSVLSRDGIPSSECTPNTSLQAKAVTISTSKTIIVCLLYLHPSENLNIVLLTRLIAQLPTPFVICGDFNGHSGLKPLCKLCRTSLPPAMWARFTVFWACRPCRPAGWLALLLTKAGDVETNPGPTTLNKKVWICDICHKQIHVRKQISIHKVQQD